MAILFTFDANAVTINGSVGGGGYCLFKGDMSCAWCSGGSINYPPSYCDETYASCTGGVERALGNTYYYVENNKAITTWDCGPSGWTFINSKEKCDRFSYRNSSGECVMCPYPDFVYVDSEEPPFPRGDDVEYRLTGCNVQVNPGIYYKDKTGIFTFDGPDAYYQCFHTGIL